MQLRTIPQLTCSPVTKWTRSGTTAQRQLSGTHFIAQRVKSVRLRCLDDRRIADTVRLIIVRNVDAS